MHSLLQKLLHKRGIKDISELDNSEKQQFDHWDMVLSEGEITVEKVKLFCQSQLTVIEKQLANFDNTPQKNERLVIYFNVYKTIMNALTAPQAERESLEKYLRQLIKGR